MVELQSTDVSVIPAKAASAARFGHQDLFDSPAATDHALSPTTQAAIGAPALKEELGPSMVGAALLQRGLTCVAGGASFPAAPVAVGLEAKALEPIADRCCAHPKAAASV
jgi:hypothetical protein